MNRNTRTIVVVAIAIVVAALASFGVYRAIQQMPVRQVEVRSLYQVVAATDMPMGTHDHQGPGQAGRVAGRAARWPRASPPSRASSTAASSRGRGERAADRDQAGAARSRRRPAAVDSARACARSRSRSTKWSASPASSSPARASTSWSRCNAPRRQDSMTRVVVSNVQVLTAGTRYDQEKAQGRQADSRPSVVTLLVTPEDAERIALAASRGPDHADAAQPAGSAADRRRRASAPRRCSGSRRRAGGADASRRRRAPHAVVRAGRRAAGAEDLHRRSHSRRQAQRRGRSMRTLMLSFESRLVAHRSCVVRRLADAACTPAGIGSAAGAGRGDAAAAVPARRS